ncbi:unnamed protein product [Thelazia callipaeda]|uniref:ubiquitinyl hydrolase 1 n=1 Tax=Thelazia callipaeda TaxID=103827 RepID=A0A0N5CZM9_THECL|nr:unnamed protein product [Thelazia callipaeda]
MNSEQLPRTNHLYHEKQQLQLCLLHTLNTLLQKNEFKKNDLDCIAESLHDSRWFNRHRSLLGLGNYDVNVLIAALEMKNLTLKWFDSRYSTANLNLSKIFGLVFNITTRSYLSLWAGHHWFTVRQIGDAGFFNFDSKLSEPIPIQDLVSFSDSLLAQGAQLLVVLEPENVGTYLLNNESCA